MPDIGKMNNLLVLRVEDCGLFLDGGKLGDILLPRRYASKESRAGDTVEVFLMRDTDDRLLATTLKPVAMVGDFAYLPVVSCTPVGAFLDWGLPKDLLVPFREQKISMKEGRSYLVRIYLDTLSGRITATSKLDRFLDKTSVDYQPRQAVEMMICSKTDLGYKVIVNGTHWGLVFHSNVFRKLECGQVLGGFIQQVREDGKLNLTFEKPGYEKVPDISDKILSYLRTQGGFMSVTEKSSLAEIYDLFGVSKKTYKKAIGALYKSRKISFEDGGTKLVEPGE